jgi:hypothetical protein
VVCGWFIDDFVKLTLLVRRYRFMFVNSTITPPPYMVTVFVGAHCYVVE